MRTLTHLLLAGAAAAAILAPAQVQAQASGGQAVSALVRQGAYWRERGRKDLANQALQRALAADPRNADALAALARYAAEDGDQAAAARWTARLKAAAPSDPRARPGAIAAAAPASGRSQAAQVAEARRLAQGGAAAAAVAAYERAFGRTPPAQYQLEYYQTLAGVDARWDDGRAGLARLAQGGGPAAQLAYAQALTYREGTRRDGIVRLARLASAGGTTAATARRSWRQALIWLNGRPADAALYQAFLAANPGDAEIGRKLAQATTPARTAAPATGQAQAPRAPAAPVDRGAASRQRGFAALERGDLAAAEKAFDTAIGIKANDADALGGLGLVRLREERFDEAKTLLGRASSASPANRGRWREALTSAAFFSDLREAQQLAATNPARAEQLLRPLAEGDAKDKALAQQLLIDVLLRQNKTAEANALAAQLSATGGAAMVARSQGRIEHARAVQLWGQGDLAGAQGAFEAALAAEPADPWIRYDFARYLLARGNTTSADGLIAPLAASNAAENLHAAALYAQQRGRSAEAYTLVSRIPTSGRNAQIERLAGELQVRASIEQAKTSLAAGRGYEAIGALQALAARPDLDVGSRGEIALALYDAGDSATALAMAQQVLMQGAQGGADPAAYDGFVAVLAKAGRDAEAGALIRQVAATAPAQDPSARLSVAGLSATLAAERADRLRLAGDLAGAFDTLSPAFAIAPNNPKLLAALGRVYQSGQMPQQAGAAYEQLLRLKPGDPAALAGVAEAALAAKQYDRARSYARQALAQRPGDPELYLLSARIEQGAGDRKAALAALETARSLRQRQTTGGGVVPGVGGMASGPLGPNPFARGATGAATPSPVFAMAAPGAATPALFPSAAVPGVAPVAFQAPPAALPTYLPPAGGGVFAAPAAPAMVAQVPAAPGNPFRAGAADPVSAAIDRQIADIRGDVAPRLDASVDVRSRSGEAGLSQLDEVSGKASASMGVPGGRLGASVTAVSVDGGETTADSRQRFGANPVPSALAIVGGGQPAPPDPGPQTASGVALALEYRTQALAIDVGTTPMGMGDVDAAGGVTFTPQLADGVQGKIWVERRPVTDSVTAYAGSADVYTGREWGQVLRSSAGLGISYDTGEAGFYAEGSASQYDGRATSDNSSYQVNLGGYVRPWRTDRDELQVGLNINHQAYDNNQNFFTYGHGGYFSPQEFTSVTVPVSYRGVRGPWSFTAELAPGYETYREDGAPLFPTDAALQGTMDSLAALNRNIASRYVARSQSGFGISAAGTVEYRMSLATSVGGRLSVNTFGDYDETKAGVYLKQTVGSAQ